MAAGKGLPRICDESHAAEPEGAKGSRTEVNALTFSEDRHGLPLPVFSVNTLLAVLPTHL